LLYLQSIENAITLRTYSSWLPQEIIFSPTVCNIFEIQLVNQILLLSIKNSVTSPNFLVCLLCQWVSASSFDFSFQIWKFQLKRLSNNSWFNSANSAVLIASIVKFTHQPLNRERHHDLLSSRPSTGGRLQV
jgi:hypothetical protein